MKNKTAVIIQCRLSSTRLPGKALKLLDSKELLAWVLLSMKKVPADRYFVATDEDSFNSLKPVCDEYGFELYKGDLNNVLKRFCDLIREINVDIVVRATADNPFLMYEAAIDSLKLMENKLLNGENCDYLTFSGLPHGCGVEIINAKSLLSAEKNTDLAYDKEHVGPALYNHKDLFNCLFVPAPEKYNFPNLRSTIDTFSDYLRALKVVSYLKQNNLYNENEPVVTENIIKALTSQEVANPIVFVPSVKKGHGTGHLLRCLEAAIENKSFVYIPDNKTLVATENIIETFIEKGLQKWQIINQLPDSTYEHVIVTDLFCTSKEEYVQFCNSEMIISLDEGSEFSKHSDYLLDIIPSYKLNRISNDNDISLMSMPEKKRNNRPKDIKKILICIGGEDPASLTEKSALIIKDLIPDSIITVITTKEMNLSGVNKIKPVKDLRNILYDFDLVITHYGLTAFESVGANTNVILVSTTKLHENLAYKYKFNYIPYNKLNSKNFSKALKKIDLNSSILDERKDITLGSKIYNLSFGKKLLCPVCNKNNYDDEIVSRNHSRTYRKCNDCGMIYIAWSNVEDKKYEKSYFFDDYKKQYGKTYQEDFESIKKTGISRIKNILDIAGKDNRTLLDIGCAYGPFLSAANDFGIIPYGTDISSDAVLYVKDELGFKAEVSTFPLFDSKALFDIEQFDICSMWYVIEHFKDLSAVINKVNKLLKLNGVFAFSTPSAQGVSGIKNKNNFYEISPTDHFSVWDFKSAEKVLEKFGFKVEKIVSTGHHPDRFPFIKKHNIQKKSLLWKIYEKYSKTKKLGDTMEVYCRKIREV